MFNKLCPCIQGQHQRWPSKAAVLPAVMAMVPAVMTTALGAVTMTLAASMTVASKAREKPGNDTASSARLRNDHGSKVKIFFYPFIYHNPDRTLARRGG